MPVIALEGPDRCGKTTVFQRLQDMLARTKFVPGLHMSRNLLSVMHDVEKRHEQLWRCMYDAHTLYVTDRHVAVSSQVYDRLYDRPALDVSYWYRRVHVFYIDVPEKELRRRYAVAGDEFFDERLYKRVLQIYGDVLPLFRYIRVDGMQTPDFIAEQVAAYVRSLRS